MDIFKERRSIRRFTQEKISPELLDYIADCGRLAPSAANMQPVKLCIITEKAKEIFPLTKWAGYLPDWSPSPNESPVAYIAIIGDTDIKANGDFELDAGIIGAAMTYAAESKGISSCWLGAIDRKEISKLLELKENYKLLYLIGFGYKNQESSMTDMSDSIKYTMDEKGKITVPKRSFKSVVSYK